MEFHIRLSGMHVNRDALQARLLDIDPAALLDSDRHDELRVAAAITTPALVDLMHRCGCPITPTQVLEVPSFCCGGCST